MTRIYKIFKIAVFISVIFAIISLFSLTIDPARTKAGLDKFDKAAIALNSEQENSIDVVVVGDSEAYRSVIPLEMYNKYGFTTYVAGSPAQKTYQSYEMIKTVLERQKPQICILEPNVLFRDYSLVSSLAPRIEKTFPIFKYHNAWKGMVDSDYEYEDVTIDSLKGYRYTTEIKPASNANYMIQTDTTEIISKTNLDDFSRICRICEENNIKLILLRTPSSKNWNYAKYNAVRQLAEKQKVTFIDLNLDNAVGIDWSQDTFDRGDHLNQFGAEKVTEFLGEYLNDRFNLPDHRSDKKYEQWQKAYEKYEKKVR